MSNILQNYPEKQCNAMLFEKQLHYFDVIVEISSSLHKMGKMGRKKKLEEILLPQLVIFLSRTIPSWGLGYCGW